MTEATNIRRVLATVMLALAMVVSSLAYTAVDAAPASAHTNGCSHSSHSDWHTVRFHYDYHHVHGGVASWNSPGYHWHQTHNHTHGTYDYIQGGCRNH
jgi:hypothetical protein